MIANPVQAFSGGRRECLGEDLHIAQEPVRIYIEVRGGVVQNIDAPMFVDVNVIDWDDLNTDPATAWAELSVEAQQFITEHYPNDVSELHARERVGQEEEQ